MVYDRIHVVLMDEATSFVRAQARKVQEKITYNLRKVELGIKDSNLFKKIDGSEIWEFRVLYYGNCYRLFAFWDKKTGNLIVVTHGTVKKSQKTAPKEIRKAEEMRRKYYEEK